MATELSHLFYAQKVLAKDLGFFNKKDFFLGTVFPDIRYLGVITREESHGQLKSFNEISEVESSFMAGVHFHTLMDYARQTFIRNNGFYRKYENGHQYTISGKLFEDFLLFKQVENKAEIIESFLKVTKEGIGFNIEEQAIQSWFNEIAKYLEVGPNNESIERFLRFLGFRDEPITLILNNIEKMLSDPWLNDLITEFDLTFDHWMRQDIRTMKLE